MNRKVSEGLKDYKEELRKHFELLKKKGGHVLALETINRLFHEKETETIESVSVLKGIEKALGLSEKEILKIANEVLTGLYLKS